MPHGNLSSGAQKDPSSQFEQARKILGEAIVAAQAFENETGGTQRIAAEAWIHSGESDQESVSSKRV